MSAFETESMSDLSWITLTSKKKIYKLIRGIQNSAGVGLGLHLPWYAVVGFVWFVYTVLSSSRVCEKLSLSHSTVGCWEIMLYAGRSPVCHSVMSFSSYQLTFWHGNAYCLTSWWLTQRDLLIHFSEEGGICVCPSSLFGSHLSW